MKDLIFFKDEFEVKVTLVNLLTKVNYGQAEAIGYVLDKWEELDTLKDELEFTRNYIHDNGLEWDLLSKYNEYCKRKSD